jgi:L-fuconolactonase
MPDFAIVDSHVHLADPKRFAYAWTKNAPSLNRHCAAGALTKAARAGEDRPIVSCRGRCRFPQHVAEAPWVESLPSAIRGWPG